MTHDGFRANDAAVAIYDEREVYRCLTAYPRVRSYAEFGPRLVVTKLVVVGDRDGIGANAPRRFAKLLRGRDHCFAFLRFRRRCQSPKLLAQREVL